MNRTKKIVLLGHCILNANAKVEGLATYSAGVESLVVGLIRKGVGIIQLPCPETTCYGIKRWGHVWEQFDTPHFRKHCRQIFEPCMEQILDYSNNGYKIMGLVGLDGSPSCGVNLTCSGTSWGGSLESDPLLSDKLKQVDMVPQMGIFMEEIAKRLKAENIEIQMLGLDEMEIEENVEIVLNRL